MQDQNEGTVPGVTSVANGLDTAIKVFVLLKVMLQTAFWGLMLGLTIWFLVDNPLPRIMEAFQRQATESLMGSFK